MIQYIFLDVGKFYKRHHTDSLTCYKHKQSCLTEILDRCVTDGGIT